MIFTIDMLAEFLREEGFTIHAVDCFVDEPDTPPHRATRAWQAVEVDLDDKAAGAVEFVPSQAMLYVWLMQHGPANVIAQIPLADPQCFEKVVAALRSTP